MHLTDVRYEAYPTSIHLLPILSLNFMLKSVRVLSNDAPNSKATHSSFEE